MKLTAYDELVAATEAERQAFMAIPLVQRALREGVDRATYLAFLEQAYHHVKHTCRLLGLALACCADRDGRYIAALLEYLEEERGHEAWILDDIRALGGDAALVAAGEGAVPTRAMVAFVHYAIQHEGPYAMLGMVHVLEGLSAQLALGAAHKLRVSVGAAGEGGFSYLASHGQLDQQHVAFFRELVDGVEGAEDRRAILDVARAVYRLYGDMFREVDAQMAGGRRAA
jgi:pyrroloquinoline quinone (PQQ) biosynthesis protein C